MDSIYKLMNKINDQDSLTEKYNVKDEKDLVTLHESLRKPLNEGIGLYTTHGTLVLEQSQASRIPLNSHVSLNNLNRDAMDVLKIKIDSKVKPSQLLGIVVGAYKPTPEHVRDYALLLGLLTGKKFSDSAASSATIYKIRVPETFKATQNRDREMLLPGWFVSQIEEQAYIDAMNRLFPRKGLDKLVHGKDKRFNAVDGGGRAYFDKKLKNKKITESLSTEAEWEELDSAETMDDERSWQPLRLWKNKTENKYVIIIGDNYPWEGYVNMEFDNEAEAEHEFAAYLNEPYYNTDYEDDYDDDIDEKYDLIEDVKKLQEAEAPKSNRSSIKARVNELIDMVDWSKWEKFTSTGDDTKPEVKRTKAIDDGIRVDVYLGWDYGRHGDDFQEYVKATNEKFEAFAAIVRKQEPSWSVKFAKSHGSRGVTWTNYWAQVTTTLPVAE